MYRIVSRESGGVTQYGIEGKGIAVHDVTESKLWAAFFTYLLNYYEVSPLHIYDVVENGFAYLANPCGKLLHMQTAYEASYCVG